MPSNAQNKVSGSKKENKHSTAKNAAQSVPARDATSKNTKADTVQNQGGTNVQIPASKAAQGAGLADPALNTIPDTTDEVSSGVGVNKKKQKRRQKEAARRAAEQAALHGPPLDPELVGLPNA